jgi:hypothetical protein
MIIMPFYKDSNTVLDYKIINGRLSLYCPKSKLSYNISPDESILMGVTLLDAENTEKYTSWLQNCKWDRSISYLDIECESCKADLVKRLLTPLNKIELFICMKCSYVWSN